MREKSDKTKIKEGRGQITEAGYNAWKLAREAHSKGTSSMIYDPVSGRSVNCLSKAEKKVFYMLRFHDGVEEIYDQFPMEKDGDNGTDAVCRKIGIKPYGHVLSTDFLVKKADGSFVAISVKPSEDVFHVKGKRLASLVCRQEVEKKYWEARNIIFRIVFADDINDVLYANIRNVMRYYPIEMAVGKEGKLKHLIARKVIRVDNIDRDYIPSAVLAKELDVEKMFRAHYDNEGGRV